MYYLLFQAHVILSWWWINWLRNGINITLNNWMTNGTKKCADTHTHTHTHTSFCTWYYQNQHFSRRKAIKCMQTNRKNIPHCSSLGARYIKITIFRAEKKFSLLLFSFYVPFVLGPACYSLCLNRAPIEAGLLRNLVGRALSINHPVIGWKTVSGGLAMALAS